MAGRREHKVAGVVTGVATALATARKNASPIEIAAELLGGGLGGNLGSWIPDGFEPAVHSYHRNVVHSVATATTVAVRGRKRVLTWQAQLRAKADGYAAQRASTSDMLRRIALWFAEMACRVAAGFVVGVIPGYLSHLVLDARTPRGIPLLSARIG